MGTSLAMAHMKAMSSRAIAVTAMLLCLPRATRVDPLATLRHE